MPVRSQINILKHICTPYPFSPPFERNFPNIGSGSTCPNWNWNCCTQHVNFYMNGCFIMKYGTVRFFFNCQKFGHFGFFFYRTKFSNVRLDLPCPSLFTYDIRTHAILDFSILAPFSFPGFNMLCIFIPLVSG